MKIPILPIIAAVTLLGACTQNKEDLYFEANTTLPLGNISVSTEKLLSIANVGDQVKPNEDGIVQYTLNDHNTVIDESNFKQIFTLPNQTIRFSKTFAPILSSPNLIPIPTPITEHVALTGLTDEKITSIVIKNGTLLVKSEGTTDLSGIVITIPQITKNNKPLTLGSTSNITLDDSYCIKPSADNTLDITITGAIPGNASEISLSIDLAINNIKSAEGFFGRKETPSITTNISIEEEEFNKFLVNTDFIYFENPSISVKVQNSFDVPIMATLTRIIIDGKPIEFKKGLGNDRFLITNDDESSITICNNQTTNGFGISQAITKNFNSIELTVETIANPTSTDLGDPSYVAPTTNHINDKDLVNAIYDINIPFDVAIKNLTITDSTAVDLSTLLPPENEYHEIAFAIAGTNSLPLNVNICPYITTNNKPDGPKTPLFTESFTIEAPKSKLKPTDPAFVPHIVPRETPILKFVDQKTITQLLQAKTLFFDLTSTTNDVNENAAPGDINTSKLYMESKLDLKITLGVNTSINLGAK